MSFLYASNGALIWHLDARPAEPVSRTLRDFHTPEALAARFAENPHSALEWLPGTAPERIKRLRPYQRECILAVDQALIGGKRDLLVAMATGTGKTFLILDSLFPRQNRPDYRRHSARGKRL